METGLSKNPIDHLRHRAAARSAAFIEEEGRRAMIFPRKQRLWPWLAKQIPAATHGTIEVRPVRVLPNRD